MSLVFQYGSNVTRARINSPGRLNGHAQDRGPARTIAGYDIAFDVWSRANGCAAADLVPAADTEAWGVLYEVADEFIRGKRTHRQKTLAQIEGPRYEEIEVDVRSHQGQPVRAASFVVRKGDRRTDLATSAAYVSWIIYGLRHHGAPEAYISHVAEVAIQTNARARPGAAEETALIKTL